jgi:hypothetical protein
MIQSKLKAARRECLETLGITESGLRELEDEAQAHLEPGDGVPTEYGTVQKIYAKPVEFSVRRKVNGAEPFKHKLKLLQEEQ